LKSPDPMLRLESFLEPAGPGGTISLKPVGQAPRSGKAPSDVMAVLSKREPLFSVRKGEGPYSEEGNNRAKKEDPQEKMKKGNLLRERITF